MASKDSLRVFSKPVLLLGGVLLFFVLREMFGNLLYAVVLRLFGLSEGDVLAFVTSNGILLVAASLAVGLIYWAGHAHKIDANEDTQQASDAEHQSQRYAPVKWGTEHIQRAKGLSHLRGWDELRDAASLGNITIFGRPENSRHKPLMPIPVEHWRKYDFDYLRCQFDPDPLNCSSDPDDPTRDFKGYCFRGLQVLRAEVEKHWVLPPPTAALDNPTVVYFVTGDTFNFSYTAPQPPITRVRASISFSFPEMRIINAANISFLVDTNSNEFTVGFVEPMEDDYFASVTADKTCAWSVEKKSAYSCTLKLGSPTDNRFKILFEKA